MHGDDSANKTKNKEGKKNLLSLLGERSDSSCHASTALRLLLAEITKNQILYYYYYYF